MADNFGMTREVALTTTAAEITRTQGSFGIELQNLGPNPIWVALDDVAKCIATKCRRIDANGGVWAVDALWRVKIYALAGTTNQATGAATIVNEVT